MTDPDALRRLLQDALGGDERTFFDPTGNAVRVGQAIVTHMLAQRDRLDGRERYFPLLPGLLEKPQEIWVGFDRHKKSGRVRMRRRYIRYFDLGENEAVGLVGELDARNLWSGLTFFRGAIRRICGRGYGSTGLRRDDSKP